jgi:methionyl-tRNA formyltransferase
MRNLIKEPIKTLFLGTDWESVETLKALYKDKRFDIVGVITTVDKPVGRKQTLTPSKVKEFALENGIKIFHTEKQKERYEKALEIFKPELIVCKAFGEILPDFFINYPKYKSINVHFSLLPKYRGAVPIQKAILDGEKETGISFMLMSSGLDEGDILKTIKEPIYDTDTNLSLRKRLVEISASSIGEVLEQWINGTIQPQKQDSSQATYCWRKDISKENAQIQWGKMEPEYIERLVRAMIPWPVAWCIIENKRTKIFKVKITKKESNLKPGSLLKEEGKLFISTNKRDVCLEILDLQIEGKQRMSTAEYINGNRNTKF